MKIQWFPIFTLDESLFINLKHMNQSYFHYYLPDFYVHYVLSTWFFHDFWSDLTGIPILWPKTRLNFAAMRTWCHFFFSESDIWMESDINFFKCHLMSLDVTWCHCAFPSGWSLWFFSGANNVGNGGCWDDCEDTYGIISPFPTKH